MADQYLQFSTRLNSANVYGFGEHEHHSLRHDMNWRTWPLWTRDHAVNTVSYTKLFHSHQSYVSHFHASWQSANLYGQQPAYINVEQDGSTHMVLILNANAAGNIEIMSSDYFGCVLRLKFITDVTLMPSPGLTYRTIGGVLDIYFFMGPGPEEAVNQYLTVSSTLTLPLKVDFNNSSSHSGYWHSNHGTILVTRIPTVSMGVCKFGPPSGCCGKDAAL